MPQENQSGKLGKSSSPVVDRVIQNSKNVQQPVNVPGVTKSGQYNKQPIKP
jgi:hypothetical protein